MNSFLIHGLNYIFLARNTKFLDHKFPISVNHNFTSILKCRGDSSVRRAHHIGVDDRVIVAETSPFFLSRIRDIAHIGIFVGHTECDMCVTKWSSDIFVIERFSHEFRDS